MYRELTEAIAASHDLSGLMTVDRWRRMKLERKGRQFNPEARPECEDKEPRINIFSCFPLVVEPKGLSAGETRILIMGGAISVVILGIVGFLLFRA